MTDCFTYHFMHSFPRTSCGGGCRTQQGFRNTSCYTFLKAMYLEQGSGTQCSKDSGRRFRLYRRPRRLLPKFQLWIDLCTEELCLNKGLITETKGNFSCIISFRIMSALQAGWYSGFKSFFFSLVQLCRTKIYKTRQ